MAGPAVSALPSMLIGYLTGGPATPTKEGAPLHESTGHNLSNSHHNQFPESLSSPSSQTHSSKELPLHDTPRSSRYNPNRNSLPLMLGDTDGFTSREGSLNGKSKKRLSRPRTSFSINHAPPKGSARHKIHVRARPLLQLQQLSISSRPMPAFELLPSAIFSPSLSRAISKAFRTRHGLCPADLAIVKAEKYHQHEDSHKEEDESRDVLALICKGRKGDGNAASKAKIFLEDGSEWEAYPLPNGGYEFFSTDEHGLGMTARWVPRRPRARRSQSYSEVAALSPEPSNRKFTFSTISPSSRRHPIIASLTSTSLDINDSYVVPSPLAPSPEISPPGSDHEAAGPESPQLGTSDPMETTPFLKTLITATAIWVTLREGWCPGYKYDDLLMRSPSLKLNNSPTKNAAEFSAAASSKDDMPRRSGSVARLLRSASGLKRRSTSSVPLDGASEELSVSRNASIRAATRRSRAESTSTVIVHSKRPRGRRADTTSTTASSDRPTAFDHHHGDMTEEEETIENTAAMLAKSSKHSSAPTPLIPSLDSADDEDEEKDKPSTSVPVKAQEPATYSKRVSSTTSSNMSIDAKKAAPDVAAKPKKSRRLIRSLFCGMVG